VGVALLAAQFSIPVISPTASSSELSDKTLYPTFNRVVAADDGQSIALAKLCQHYGWGRVGVLATTDASATKMVLTFSAAAAANNVRILLVSSYPSGTGVDTTPTAAQAADIQTGLRLLKLAGMLS
jgi:ABC-type branched-subunit amino acid transport system substrate-binding protein